MNTFLQSDKETYLPEFRNTTVSMSFDVEHFSKYNTV